MLCTRFENGGHCYHGDKCQFAHGPAELQAYSGGGGFYPQQVDRQPPGYDRQRFDRQEVDKSQLPQRPSAYAAPTPAPAPPVRYAAPMPAPAPLAPASGVRWSAGAPAAPLSALLKSSPGSR
jgi:hypothetical protein